MHENETLDIWKQRTKTVTGQGTALEWSSKDMYYIWENWWRNGAPDKERYRKIQRQRFFLSMKVCFSLLQIEWG
jgi:hypothetical protein